MTRKPCGDTPRTGSRPDECVGRLAAFVTGCEPANRTNETERLQESAATQYEAAQDATQEAIQAAGDYAETQRTAFNDTREWLSEKIAPDQG
jgi:hypothetical protein